MKKVLLAAGMFLALTAHQASAQDQGFHAGLTTGYYYTTILDKGLFDSPTFDHQTTFRAAPIGLALGYQWDGGAGIQVEVISGKIGQEMDIRTLSGPGGDFIVSGKKEINLTYLQIPILFKKQWGEEKARFNWQIGPQISFLMKGEDFEIYNTDNVIYTGTNDYVFDTTPGEKIVFGSTETKDSPDYKFNNMAVGLVTGFGLDYHLTDEIYLSGNLRFGYNFTEVREEKGGEKYVDTAIDALTLKDVPLYKSELRSAAFGGIQIGIHYFLAQ